MVKNRCDAAMAAQRYRKSAVMLDPSTDCLRGMHTRKARTPQGLAAK